MEKPKRTPIRLGQLVGNTLGGFVWLFFKVLPGLLVIVVAIVVLAIAVNFSNSLSNGIGTFFSSMGEMLAGANTTSEIDISQIRIPEVEPFNELSQLTTMRYNYANIVTISTEMPSVLQALYGNSLALVAVGHIEAGVDMGQLTREDMVYDGETRTLTLNIPAPILTACYLDVQKTYVAEQRTGIFAPNQPRLSDESRRYALLRFRDIATEEGIITDAQAKAESVVQNFASTLINVQVGEGDPAVNVVVTTKAPLENAPLVETCR